MKCPKCGSTNVTPSHKRGVERALQYVYPKVPYRCKECWSRYWKLQSPLANRKSLIGTIAIMILVILFLVLPFLPSQENGVSSTGPASPDRPDTPPAAAVSQTDSPDIAPFEPDAPTEGSEAAGTVANVESPVVDVTEPPVAEPTAAHETIAAPADAVEANDVPESNAETAALTPDAAAETAGIPAPEETTAAAAPEARVAESAKPAPTPAERTRQDRSRVTAIRQLTGEEGFRMALESSGSIQDFTTFTMDSPPRLVINLSGAWEIRGRRTFPMQGDLVERVRIGEHPKHLSVVLDLKRAVPSAPRIEKTDKGFTLTLKNG